MIGTRIGPYEIVGWLGAGGMGEVYRARDPRLGRDVAIKVIGAAFAADASRVHRFEQEARAAGQLNHPNILAVHDAGIHDGAPYIVSELLEGESLRSRLQAGVLPSRKAIEYARQAAEGLAAAHDKGIVHRDVKPDNLFITSDGRIKILDFGVAKLATRDTDGGGRTGVPTDTAAGTVVGTAGYMSPEQVRGEVVDARSDIFSVGTVLYEMLTGRAPFSRETAAESMTAILKEDPPEPRSPDIPPALARIIARCLEKAREARFQSARDLAFGLDVLSGTHATAAPATVLSPPRRWPTAVGVAIVVLSLAAAVASWLKPTTPPSFELRLANASFTPFTNFEGSELDAAISPDGKFVVFLSDRDGPFHGWLKQVSTGALVPLTPGAVDQKNPGPVRVYAGQQTAFASLLAVRPDGSPVPLPLIRVQSGGGGRARFLPNGDVVYIRGLVGTQDFWLLDRATNTTHQLTRLSNPATTTSFDITPDGKHIVFDRVREQSDLVLIDLPK
jgi:eukaryotic-like serine/threonine-protein kinase